MLHYSSQFKNGHTAENTTVKLPLTHIKSVFLGKDLTQIKDAQTLDCRHTAVKLTRLES